MANDKTVLVVDDSRNNVEFLSDLLEIYQYKVQVASSGRRAFELMQAMPPPDLVLLDLIMPDWDGMKVLEAMREQGIDIPVIVISARENEAEIERVVELGARYYVTKPVMIRDLVAKIEACLGAAQEPRKA